MQIEIAKFPTVCGKKKKKKQFFQWRANSRGRTQVHNTKKPWRQTSTVWRQKHFASAKKPISFLSIKQSQHGRQWQIVSQLSAEKRRSLPGFNLSRMVAITVSKFATISTSEDCLAAKSWHDMQKINTVVLRRAKFRKCLFSPYETTAYIQSDKNNTENLK